MKSIYFAIPSLVLFVLMSLQVHAQPPRDDMTPEEMAERQTERLKKELDLTDDQYELIYAINIRSSTQIKELRQESKGDREVMRDKMMHIRKEQDANITGILSDTQLVKYQELKKNRRRPGEGPRERGPRGEEGDKK